MHEGGKSSSVEQLIKDFVQDANRFLLYHKYCVQEYPLQIYAGCLVFSPKDSIVKNCFQSHAPKWVTVAPGLDSTWDPCLQTLKEHQGNLTTVAYSPDDKCLVSGPKDGTVKFWDAESGTCIHTCTHQGDEGRDTPTYHTTFSNDGKSFVSASKDGNVAIWDLSTGNLISRQRAHKVETWTMAMSSDGCTFAYLLTRTIVLI